MFGKEPLRPQSLVLFVMTALRALPLRQRDAAFARRLAVDGF